MPITNVEIIEDFEDGNVRRVTFRGEDQDNEWHTTTPTYYDISVNPADILPTIAAQIENRLIEREIAGWWAGESANDFKFATKQMLVGPVREAYRGARRLDLLAIAKRLYEAWQNNEFTLNQLKNAFNMTDEQFNQLLAKIQRQRNLWVDVENEVGE